MANRKTKPKFDQMTKKIQVPIKEHEFKILDRIRRDSPFTTIAAYVRSLILDNIKRKNQTELL
jgi:hypothetical protein